eukprot:764414-Hanusia_phi.AAC.6
MQRPAMEVQERAQRTRTKHLDAVPDLPDLYNEPVYDDHPDDLRKSRSLQARARGGDHEPDRQSEGQKQSSGAGTKSAQEPKKRATTQWRAFQEERERVRKMCALLLLMLFVYS